MLNQHVWRYIENDDDFIQIYGPEATPPDEDFPLAVYQINEDHIIYMTEGEAFRLFFSLSEYDI